MKYPLYLLLAIVSLISLISLGAMGKPTSIAPKELPEKRIALLIGNGTYTSDCHSALDNPMNDVDEMERLLEAKDFEVTTVKNLDKTKMTAAINKFIIKIRRETSNKRQKVVSLFYYAGHGNYYQQENESYLVPINASIVLPEDFKKEAYGVSDLTERLQNSKNFLNIVMLDACRANVELQKCFSDQTMGGGDPYPDLFEGVSAHAIDQANYNLFVSYSASKEGFAESGDDKADFSPYVIAFKEALAEKGTRDIDVLFKAVNKKTIQYSKINQPEVDSKFYDEFFFDKTAQSVVDENTNNTNSSVIKRPRIEKQEAYHNMVPIYGGVFERGSSKRKHNIQVDSFYMNQYEVTFEQYDAFCEATNRTKPNDRGWGREKRPVIYVSWYDAIEYCNWRSEQEKLIPCYSIDKLKKDVNNTNNSDSLQWTVTCDWKANGYRLPTEAEWEYAAGGGAEKRTKWSGTNRSTNLGDYANGDNYHTTDHYRNTSPVGRFKANNLGLHDMSGNVWEWCWGWYDADYYSSLSNTVATKNPLGTVGGSQKIIRGGSWNDFFDSIRVSYRTSSPPAHTSLNLGFRCVRAY